MIEREIKYVFKLSYDYPATDIFYVGGSPINTRSGKLNDTITGAGDYTGVVMNNNQVDKLTGAGTVIFAPAQLKIKKDADEATDHTTKTDGYYPWDATKNYVEGEVLKLAKVTVGSDNYLCWTNNVSTGDACYAKIETIAGGPAGTDITSMEIILGSYIAL